MRKSWRCLGFDLVSAVFLDVGNGALCGFAQELINSLCSPWLLIARSTCLPAAQIVGQAYGLGVFATGVSHFRGSRKAMMHLQSQGESEAAGPDQVAGGSSESHSLLTRAIEFLSDSMLTAHAAVALAAMLSFLIGGVRYSVVNGSWSWSAGLTALAVFFGLVHLCMFAHMLLVSWRLVKQLENETVGSLFLLRVYLALIFLFASAYYVTFLALGAQSFALGSAAGLNDFEGSAGDLPRLFYRFIYFSVTIASSTGSGDILAIYMLPRILVFLQIMVSFYVR